MNKVLSRLQNIHTVGLLKRPLQGHMKLQGITFYMFLDLN